MTTASSFPSVSFRTDACWPWWGGITNGRGDCGGNSNGGGAPHRLAGHVVHHTKPWVAGVVVGKVHCRQGCLAER